MGFLSSWYTTYSTNNSKGLTKCVKYSLLSGITAVSRHRVTPLANYSDSVLPFFTSSPYARKTNENEVY